MALAYTEISKNKTKTWFLLILFIAFVMAVGFMFGEANASGGGMVGLTIAGIMAVVWVVVTYFWGAKITLGASGAKLIEKKDNPQLYNTIENLAITAGLPTPKIYMIDSPALNAFATGRDPNHSVIAVTKGILEKLEKKELEGVLAHEMSHVGNYDIRLLLIVTALAGVVMIMTDVFWRVQFYGGRGGGKRGGQAQIILLLVAVLLLIFAPIFATLIKLAISRKREFLADASGVLLTRYPQGLISALEKISKDPTPLRQATKGTAHMYISNPFKKGFWAGLFSTHPPVEERIKALKGMDV